jgi:type IV secretion system protein VirD4
VVSYAGNRSLVTIAPPESGKTLSQALPALLNFAGHVVVLDIKGSLHEKTALRRQQAFNSRIVNFNPTNAQGAHFNPLLLVSDDPDDCFDEAMVLAQLIVPERSEKDASWAHMGQNLVAVFIAYTVMTATEPELRTMNKVLNLVAGIGTAEAIGLILREGSEFSDAMKRAATDVFKVTEDESHAQFTGILQAVKGGLSIWNNSQVARASKRCDWVPDDFRSKTPLSLYLTIPMGDLSTYGPLIRVILAQHVFALMKQLPPSDTLPILFLLDEFPQLGRVEPIKKAIEFGREYGIRTWLFAQFARQFEEAYGRAGGEGMIEICGVRMYMNPRDRDAENISKSFGSQTSILSEKKEPNLPPEEITGPAHRDSVFVLSTNETPLVLSKNFPPA